MLTFRRSFLSARRAATSPIKYIPNMRHTVERTTKFPVSPSLLNSVQTLLKSMGFGATKMLPPNAERCVHRQCSFPSTAFHPTLRKIKTIICDFKTFQSFVQALQSLSLLCKVFSSSHHLLGTNEKSTSISNINLIGTPKISQKCL